MRALAEALVGDLEHFHYRSSSLITEFFEDCGIDFVHDGSTRWRWAADRLEELLQDPHPQFAVPERFAHVMRILMDKAEASDEDPDRSLALETLSGPLRREGFEAYYGEDRLLYIRHTGTKTISRAANPHRPFTRQEAERREHLAGYLSRCSEDELIEVVLLPLFRQLGYHRITATGHRDKALEYGKDIWMRYALPTQHVIYFGIQAKKDKLDAAGTSRNSNANVAEIYNQVLMMLGHEIFDPETSRRVLVDHALIVSGGEITKQARNWIGNKLDATKRSQIMFMDRDDILNLYVAAGLPLPEDAVPDPSRDFDDDIPF